MVQRVPRARAWLVIAAVVCTLGVLLPPLGVAVGRYAFAEALQFAVLATAGPALLVLGAPWRSWARIRGHETVLGDRVARSRSRRSGGLRAWAVLGTFMLAAIVWRVPALVDALARHPVLALVELATLFPAGCLLWLELVASPPLLPRISRPLRALFAAISMWTIWVLAYIMGFSQAGWAAVYAHHSGLAVTPAADQQIATGILWAVPALCCVPVIFASLLSWLTDSSDPDVELREIPAMASGQTPLSPRPPRGWRTSEAGAQPGRQHQAD
jgi:cytochrome c oxidase assembly factor CtaG